MNRGHGVFTVETRGVAPFVRDRISRTDTAVKSISFTQQIGMKSGIKIFFTFSTRLSVWKEVPYLSLFFFFHWGLIFLWCGAWCGA